MRIWPSPLPRVLLMPLCLVLSGCWGGGGVRTAYSLSGIDQGADATLTPYLQKIVDDRLGGEFELGDDAADNARRETYREQMILTDLQKALRAKGYYDATVKYADDAAVSFTGTYNIEPGSLYTIATLTTNPPEFAAVMGKDALEPGTPLDAASVLALQEIVKERVAKDKCYFTLDVKNEVVLNPDTQTADVTYRVDVGPEAKLGRVTFTGQSTVKTSYLDKLVPWNEGDCFRERRVERLKTALMESGLFSRAESVLPAAPDENGMVAVEVKLSERAHRTMKAGLSYYTDEGPGATFGWEHRNYWGAAEKLTTTLSLSALKQSLSANVLKPFFIRKDQSLSLNTEVRRQDTDAFEESGVDVGASINRTFNKRLTGSTGVKFTLSEITEDNDVNDSDDLYGLISFPNSLTFDNRNDTLDPTKGWRIFGSATPFLDVLGVSDPFFKLEFGASTYWALDEKKWSILALRTNIGSILGSGTFDIPSTERFFAGGGGSVRGYGYQEVGPKDSNDDPLGGRSMVTGSVEMRQRFTTTLGAVAFVDAGTVSNESWPKMNDVAVGAGIGARYYSGFGPIRFDVAVPLTQKDDLESNFQIYISIGQAF
ncbi:autotransporter assembly complex protein TamA [Micavibrio aeruginosavorus]|uniref:autotransporter assembly complex protein TamA n=1 Tax=Micavibrio aeruginosavorus TaxID=349221 RepID=UPI003F4AC605